MLLRESLFAGADEGDEEVQAKRMAIDKKLLQLINSACEAKKVRPQPFIALCTTFYTTFHSSVYNLDTTFYGLVYNLSYNLLWLYIQPFIAGVYNLL